MATDLNDCSITHLSFAGTACRFGVFDCFVFEYQTKPHRSSFETAQANWEILKPMEAKFIGMLSSMAIPE